MSVLTALLCLGLTGQSGSPPLFNGKDLSGWERVNCPPETFTVRDGAIVCSGSPRGFLRSSRMYENFVFELEWKLDDPWGDAGISIHGDGLPAVGQRFPRSITAEIRNSGHPDGSWTRHGDLFATGGASLTPDRPHPKGWMRCLASDDQATKPGTWNRYRIESRNGRVTLAVNGKVVSGVDRCEPRKGYLCLESEGSRVVFRKITLRELPSSNPLADQIAEDATGFTSIFNGSDLRGWVPDEGHDGHWRARDGSITHDGLSKVHRKHLNTVRKFRDYVLIGDWRFPGKILRAKRQIILPDGSYKRDAEGRELIQEFDDAGDSGFFLRSGRRSQVGIWCWPVGSGELWDIRLDLTLSPEVRAGAVPMVRADNPLGSWNRYRITIKGDRVTAVLNGKTVLENAALPGIQREGSIVLQTNMGEIEFRNLFVKDLD